MTKETLAVGKFLQEKIEKVEAQLKQIDSIKSVHCREVLFFGTKDARILLWHSDPISKMAPEGYEELKKDLATATKVYSMLLKEAYENKLRQLQDMLTNLSDSNSGDIAHAFSIDLTR